MLRRWTRPCSVAAALLAAAAPAALSAEARLLFAESFEDTQWTERGWYDGPHMEIVAADDAPEGKTVCIWDWQHAGDVSPSGGGARASLPPVTEVTLSAHVRHDPEWQWTGRGWHPHMFHFVTDADDKYVGPAHTHLTFYVEAVDGIPRLAIQDGRNIDEERVGQDLSAVTEARSVAGCNGDSDGHGEGDCYSVGARHANGKVWQADGIWFSADKGPRYMGDWHHVQAHFRLNTVVDGVAQRDGALQYWYDGELLIDFADVVFRTGQHPDMHIDQFLMTPYYGPGVPRAQRMWVDDLRIYEGRPEVGTAVGRDGPGWGQVKARHGR